MKLFCYTSKMAANPLHGNSLLVRMHVPVCTQHAQLLFWYRCVTRKAEQRGLWTDHCRIWDFSELNFLTKCSHMNRNFVWGLEANFEASELKFSRNLWFGVKVWSWELKNVEMWVLETARRAWKGLQGRTYPYPIFFRECLLGWYRTSQYC